MKRFNRIGLIVTLFAVALMMAGPALACPVSVGSFAAPSFAVAQPQAVYQSSVGVSCGQAVAAVADPQVCETAKIGRVEAIETHLLIGEIIFNGRPQNLDSAGWVVGVQMDCSTNSRQVVILSQSIQRELLIDRIRQFLCLQRIACQCKGQS